MRLHFWFSRLFVKDDATTGSSNPPLQSAAHFCKLNSTRGLSKYSLLHPSISTCIAVHLLLPFPQAQAADGCCVAAHSEGRNPLSAAACGRRVAARTRPGMEGDRLPACTKLRWTHRGCTCIPLLKPRLFITHKPGEICSVTQGAVAGRSGVCSHFNSSQTQQTCSFVVSQALILDDCNSEKAAWQRAPSSPGSGSNYAAHPCQNSSHVPSPSGSSY